MKLNVYLSGEYSEESTNECPIARINLGNSSYKSYYTTVETSCSGKFELQWETNMKERTKKSFLGRKLGPSDCKWGNRLPGIRIARTEESKIEVQRTIVFQRRAQRTETAEGRSFEEKINEEKEKVSSVSIGKKLEQKLAASCVHEAAIKPIRKVRGRKYLPVDFRRRSAL